jgi:hypothetical protein
MANSLLIYLIPLRPARPSGPLARQRPITPWARAIFKPERNTFLLKPDNFIHSGQQHGPAAWRPRGMSSARSDRDPGTAW